MHEGDGPLGGCPDQGAVVFLAISLSSLSFTFHLHTFYPSLPLAYVTLQEILAISDKDLREQRMAAFIAAVREVLPKSSFAVT